jgi:environmental stress-induced protein Ves
MTLQRFALDSLPEAPWKNGGGTTREVACWPPGAGLDSFDWRVSIATIAASGPFSAFAGIDRTIMLLEGAGARLQSPDFSIDQQLVQPLVAFSFPGEAAPNCELLGGASSDLNVMVRRERLHAEVCVVRQDAAFEAAPHGLLLAVNGDWMLKVRSDAQEDPDAIRLAQNEGVWWGGASRVATLEGPGADASLIAVTFKQQTPR